MLFLVDGWHTLVRREMQSDLETVRHIGQQNTKFGALGLSVYTSPCGECTSSLITRTFGNNADCIFFFEPAITFLHHLPVGSGTILCTMHLVVHVLFFFTVFSTLSSLRLCSALMTTSFGPLQLALKCVYFTDQDFKILT